ncbi:class I SAM-dependent methyltransferase [Acidobacteria bacterium AH-259-D05]|nr:class I SAM-dependent methyltransferase [Acidobacteria bacterium AH-259-D05]
MRCPICEYPNVQSRYRMTDRLFEVSSEEFVLYHCSSCGLLFQQEEDIRNRLSEFYPPGYWWQDEGRISLLERVYREWVVRWDQLRFVLSIFPDQQGRLLDIGCGTGTFVKLALQAGFDAYGLEQSEEAVLIGQSNAPGRIFQGIEQDLIGRGEKFDILTLFHALEHMTNPFRYLKDIRKLLRTPGKVIIQVPNVQSVQAQIFGACWYGLDCPRHVYNYTLFSLLHLLGRAGYRIQRIRHFSLRDNAAALVSSLFPALDTMSQRVKLLKRKGKLHSWDLSIKEGTYFALFILAQPFALIEAALGRGATVTVYATIE